MDIIDIKIKDALSKNINEPYSYDKMIKSALYHKKKIKFIQVIKTIISIILGILVSTGTVFAGYTIYNKYIKQEEQVVSRGLFEDGSGHSYYEIDLMANDMTWHNDTRLYHKIITNIEDYDKYKARVSELPNMTEEDLNENFLIIIANENYREPQELDMHITDVYCDNNNTYITLKQRENPNYYDDTNIWYAIIDRSQLRENINIKIAHKEIRNENFADIKTLSKEYSIENAKKDGCIIVENAKTNEIDKIDKFLEKAKNNESSFIRIYSKKDNYNGINELEIVDLQYDNGFYYLAKRIIYSDSDNRNTDEVYDCSLFNVTKHNFKLQGEGDAFIEIIGQKYKGAASTGRIPILILNK